MQKHNLTTFYTLSLIEYIYILELQFKILCFMLKTFGAAYQLKIRMCKDN